MRSQLKYLKYFLFSAFNVSNHGIGTLGDWEHCPNLFQVNQFNIKLGVSKGITGIKLVCNDPRESVITSGGDKLYHLADLFACSEAYNKIRTRWQPDGGAFVSKYIFLLQMLILIIVRPVLITPEMKLIALIIAFRK